MPAEHRLTASGAAALFGKHPGHGDFIAAGLPDDTGRILSEWLGTTLGEVRELMGEGWAAVQDSPLALRFWLGGGVAGGGPWRGAMRMSADKVGRRYPLLVMQRAGPDSLPTVQTAQAFYQAAESALAAMLAEPALVPQQAAQGLADLFAGHAPGTEAASDPMFWAIKQTGDAAQLCAEVALTDLIAAASGRSYWWFSNEFAGASGILGCNGLPGAQALAWLLGGGVVRQDGQGGQA